MAEHQRLNRQPGCVNPQQMLFGINQGGTYPELRVRHMEQIAQLPCDGFAIGGLAVGEPTQTMYDIIDAVEPHMPREKPRYLMGVGTPSNIIEGVAAPPVPPSPGPMSAICWRRGRCWPCGWLSCTTCISITS